MAHNASTKDVLTQHTKNVTSVFQILKVKNILKVVEKHFVVVILLLPIYKRIFTFILARMTAVSTNSKPYKRK